MVLERIERLAGERVVLVSLDRNIEIWSALYKASHEHLTGKSPEEDIFWFLPCGPFPNFESYCMYLDQLLGDKLVHPFVIYALRDPNMSNFIPSPENVIGFIGYLNINDRYNVVEIGMIWTAKKFQGLGIAVEATSLLIEHAIEKCGIVRVEWKAHHLNIPSQSCAKKMGFVYEGTFRKHMYYKGAVRNTVWFSLIDEDYRRNGGVKQTLKAMTSNRKTLLQF